MAKMSHEELVSLFQDKRIDILQFVMNGDQADEFLGFCRNRFIEPTPESAQLFVSLRDLEQMNHQYINF